MGVAVTAIFVRGMVVGVVVMVGDGPGVLVGKNATGSLPKRNPKTPAAISPRMTMLSAPRKMPRRTGLAHKRPQSGWARVLLQRYFPLTLNGRHRGQVWAWLHCAQQDQPLPRFRIIGVELQRALQAVNLFFAGIYNGAEPDPVLRIGLVGA